ncbi:hypothetical protein [Rhizobium lusitanum]|uniref:hypothetical protein n=1 Tax=Rhizobium lusitanum TaxID=293958 RepID=UPI001958E725|nr:hypothetical protein [Rhizobium lusitanum]MBM7047570.1 hypothetical protein [Rhizobium lusitanum]
METDIEKRGPGRPRKEDEVRSAIRTAPIRERKRKGGQIADKYYIDPRVIPEGTSYEWKRHTVYGAPDPSYDVFMREQGWEPVTSERHPDLVADGYNGPIIRDGLMLMERPIELTREAQAEDRAAAAEVVRVKKQQLGEAPAGTLPREAPNLQNFNRTSYEAMEIDS